MTIDIKIGIKPVLKKYLASKVHTNPFVLSKTNQFGMFLYQCMVKINSTKKMDLSGVDTNKYSETLTIRISEDMWRRIGCYIPPQKQADFNQFIAKLMDDEFHYYMDCRTQIVGQQIYSSFLKFREKFDFTEDDLTIKKMEKNYERYRLTLTA